jgi:hypothetical protein
MMGLTQSTCNPVPLLALPCVKPAASQAALIFSHGPKARAGCAFNGTTPATSAAMAAAIEIDMSRIVIAPATRVSTYDRFSEEKCADRAERVVKNECYHRA